MLFKKRQIKRFLLLILMIGVLWPLGRTVHVLYGTYDYYGERKPYLQMLSDDRVTVCFRTGQKGRGMVRFGPDDKHLNSTVREHAVGANHAILLQGLKPDTTYYYAVGVEGKIIFGGDSHYWFKTAPKKGSEKKVRIWVIGDPQRHGQGGIRARDGMLKYAKENIGGQFPYVDLMITLGDNADSSGRDSEFQLAFFNRYGEILKNICVWPGFGNHDARRWAYEKIFVLPENGEFGGPASHSEKYWSFDYANIHFVQLDSQDHCEPWWMLDLGRHARMIAWLKADLQHNKSKWLIVYFHHPPYTKGRPYDSDNRQSSKGRHFRMRENILPILEDHGADMVLSGHTHAYQRSFLIDGHYGTSDTLKPAMIKDHSMGPYYKKTYGLAPHEGTLYVVAGTSSKLDHHPPLNHPVMAQNLLELGTMIIEVMGAKLDAVFINDHGEVKDRFSIIKGNHLDK